MAHATIEHVNLTVSDPRRSAEMLGAIFGWTIRWEGPAKLGGRTIHVGSDSDYLALWAPADGEPRKYDKGTPLNHVGITVDDLDATERLVEAQGLVPFSHGDYAPGRRFYFLDADGIEYEVVSYAGRGTV